MLTFFPFPSLELRAELGSTYPWLIYIAKEPLPFRYCRFSLQIGPTTTRILIFARFTSPYGKTFSQAKHLPTTIIYDVHSIGN